jgi:hypothetical protein
MKTELLRGKIRGKIGFLEGEKEMQGVGREIFKGYRGNVKFGPWAIVNIVECLVHPIDRMH